MAHVLELYNCVFWLTCYIYHYHCITLEDVTLDFLPDFLSHNDSYISLSIHSSSNYYSIVVARCISHRATLCCRSKLSNPISSFVFFSLPFFSIQMFHIPLLWNGTISSVVFPTQTANWGTALPSEILTWRKHTIVCDFLEISRSIFKKVVFHCSYAVDQLVIHQLSRVVCYQIVKSPLSLPALPLQRSYWHLMKWTLYTRRHWDM